MVDESPVELKQKARTSHACQQCRALKARCIPSTQPGICQKCLKLHKSCTFAGHQPRRKRGPGQQSTRVTKIEAKLDGLIALLGQGSAVPDSEPLQQTWGTLGADSESPQDAQLISVVPANTTERILDNTNVEASRLNRNINQDFTDCTTSLKINHDTVDHLWGLLNFHTADQVLQSFQNMIFYFPFVVLPPAATAFLMLEERPFLLLAILTSASSQDRTLQQALDSKFRSLLCQRIMLEGEKGIDLLQGLLVYLAWYHFHYVPGHQQSYQFLQLAIGMVLDLGLDQTPLEARAAQVGLDLSHHYDYVDGSSSDDFFSREARRAYIGCYYLSTNMHLGIPRRNNLKFTDYMTRCALSLKEDMEFPTDIWIPSLLSISSLEENVREMYRLEKGAIQAELAHARFLAQVKGFERQLEDWKASLPPVAEQYPLVDTTYNSVNVTIHEMGLSLSRRPIPNCSPDIEAPPPSGAIDTLFACLAATKLYFNSFLQLPQIVYPYLPVAEWARLIWATFLLYRLSTRELLPCWDFQTARKTVNLDEYLNTICYRLHSMVSPIDEAGNDRKDLYSRFGTILEEVRATYLLLKEQPYAGLEDAPAHQPFSASKPKPRTSGLVASSGRCPFLYSSRQSSENSLTDEWKTLVNTPSLLDGSLPDETRTDDYQQLWDAAMSKKLTSFDFDDLGLLPDGFLQTI